MDALLAAYRVGARVSWRELSATAVDSGVDARHRWPGSPSWSSPTSTSSRPPAWPGTPTSSRPPAGSGSGYLERLAGHLLAGATRRDRLAGAAERADWEPPPALTAVMLPGGAGPGGAGLRSGRADPPGRGPARPRRPTVAAAGPRRRRPAPAGAAAAPCAGAARWSGRRGPWLEVQRVLRPRALRARTLRAPAPDTEEHLAELVLPRRPGARWTTCAPGCSRRWTELRPGTAEKLAETLRAWLLHHGRRDEVAGRAVRAPADGALPDGAAARALRRPARRPATVLDLTIALGADGV